MSPSVSFLPEHLYSASCTTFQTCLQLWSEPKGPRKASPLQIQSRKLFDTLSKKEERKPSVFLVCSTTLFTLSSPAPFYSFSLSSITQPLCVFSHLSRFFRVSTLLLRLVCFFRFGFVSIVLHRRHFLFFMQTRPSSNCSISFLRVDHFVSFLPVLISCDLFAKPILSLVSLSERGSRTRPCVCAGDVER